MSTAVAINEIYWKNKNEHDKEHSDFPERKLSTLNTLKTLDKSCLTCYPIISIPSSKFTRFYSWISSLYPIISFSSSTIQHFEKLPSLLKGDKKETRRNLILLIFSFNFNNRFDFKLLLEHLSLFNNTTNAFDKNPYTTKPS